MSDDAGTTRGTALKRGLLIVGGALGLGAAGGAALDRGSANAAPNAKTLRLELEARNRRSSSPDRAPGRRPASGDRLVAQHDLYHGDAHAGDLVATGFTVDALGGSSVELHTITLDGGSLQGMGRAGEAGGSFAVVGGTGRFAGARGSYDLVSSGDSAALTIDLRL